MSAFAASLGGGGGGGRDSRSDMRVEVREVEIDEADMNFWQRLQHKYNCCLINIVVNAFCPTRKSGRS